MTLTTHAIVGAATAQFFPNHPYLAFFAGAAGHFLIDTIPHWDYPLVSLIKHEDKMNYDMAMDKRFVVDLFKIGLDIFLGIGLVLLIFIHPHRIFQVTTLAGTLGGIFPDGLQFLYFKIRREPLTSIQRFHVWIQKNSELKVAHHVGIALQIALIIPVVLLVKYLF